MAYLKGQMAWSKGLCFQNIDPTSKSSANIEMAWFWPSWTLVIDDQMAQIASNQFSGIFMPKMGGTHILL